MQKDIHSIVANLDDILRNSDNKSADIIGGYIVGATIVKDNIESYYNRYPMLEEIAELGAELETTKQPSNSDALLSEIKDKFAQLKQQVFNN